MLQKCSPAIKALHIRKKSSEIIAGFLCVDHNGDVGGRYQAHHGATGPVCRRSELPGRYRLFECHLPSNLVTPASAVVMGGWAMVPDGNMS